MKSNVNMRLLRGSVLAVVLCAFNLAAMTRWSSIHMIPDADLLEGGQVVVDYKSLFFDDSSGKAVYRPGGIVDYGIIEWVNVYAGYAGGFTCGFKARILGESDNSLMPSMAIGSRSMFTPEEPYYYKDDSLALSNEYYVALGKSLDIIKVRLHGGILTMPSVVSEKFNPFFGIEKYFGAGFYMSLEVEKRYYHYISSLFASWRFLKNQCELSAGLVDLKNVFYNDQNQFGFSIQAPNTYTFVKPSVWIGFRYQGKLTNLKKGKNPGFSTIDDQLAMQSKYLDTLRMQLDSLKRSRNADSVRLTGLSRTVEKISNSDNSELGRMKNYAMEKLTTLKTLYGQEPFEPEKVKTNIGQILNYRDLILPAIQEIVADSTTDRKIRQLGVTVLGEIGNRKAADALLDILGKTSDPNIKIEALIALGKMKETRAAYLMQQLANDPNDAVAYTATEVLQKLQKETGIDMSVQGSLNDTVGGYVVEKKIGVPDSLQDSLYGNRLLSGSITGVDTTIPKNIARPRAKSSIASPNTPPVRQSLQSTPRKKMSTKTSADSTLTPKSISSAKAPSGAGLSTGATAQTQTVNKGVSTSISVATDTSETFIQQQQQPAATANPQGAQPLQKKKTTPSSTDQNQNGQW